MKILVALPDTTYYLWQMIVQINNFRRLGYEDDVIYLISKNGLELSKILKNILLNGKIKSRFYIYHDDRKDLAYAPSNTAHLISKFFNDNPEYKNETFLYIDPDVIFRKKLNINDLLKNDVWYLSDTSSYINSKYIRSKSDELFKNMCDIVGIDSELVINNDNNAGGAQILMKNTNSDFWDKVEYDSVKLFKYMKDTEYKFNPKNPIQSWTAEMWAVLWNAWLFGYETKISKRLSFSWASDKISEWDKHNMYHNAGVVNIDSNVFSKLKYQKSPFFDENLKKYQNDYCSSKYVDEIIDTKINFKQIIF